MKRFSFYIYTVIVFFAGFMLSESGFNVLNLLPVPQQNQSLKVEFLKDVDLVVPNEYVAKALSAEYDFDGGGPYRMLDNTSASECKGKVDFISCTVTLHSTVNDDLVQVRAIDIKTPDAISKIISPMLQGDFVTLH
jgi:hypothetical protein